MSPLESSALRFMGAGVAYFALIYLSFGAITWLLTRHLLPKLGIGHALDLRPLGKGQLRRELSLSAASILIFGIGVVLPWGMLKLGWAHLAIDPSLARTALEIAALVLWNELHFYLNHRLLHTRPLQRFHSYHHRSIVTTPWATYSFHPIEAAMLGSVLIPPMLVHDFSLAALMSVPLFSLFYNCIGHANYDFLPWANIERWWLNGSRRHHLHHAYSNGNFGFMLPFMDRVLRTHLPDQEPHAG